MRLSSKPLSAVIALVLVLVLFGLVVVFLDPFDWFLQRSDSFSVEKFLAVEPGDNLTEVVDLLGEPIFTTRDLPLYLGCKNCSAHYFLGDPPSWLIAHREAWVLVDSEGRVIQRILNEEP